MREHVAAVVLAAGGSSRLGRPKQLVMHEGLPLVTRAAQAALRVGADPVVVVLGAHAGTVRAALSGTPVAPVVNAEWNRGMGTSVATGVRALVERAPAVAALLIIVADQPLEGDAALGRLLDAWTDADARSGDGGLHTTIAAGEYAGSIGVPAVFGRAHFSALCSLSRDTGAAWLLRRPDARVCRVAIPEAALDIDVPNDLARVATKSCRH